MYYAKHRDFALIIEKGEDRHIQTVWQLTAATIARLESDVKALNFTSILTSLWTGSTPDLNLRNENITPSSPFMLQSLEFRLLL